jgi:hypothetical protein
MLLLESMVALLCGWTWRGYLRIVGFMAETRGGDDLVRVRTLGYLRKELSGEEPALSLPLWLN